MNTNDQPRPTNYVDAVIALNGRDSRKIANNTYVELSASEWSTVPRVAIRLHGTDIVTHFANDLTMLTTGGYRTATTKERLNRYLPTGAKVIQLVNTWFYIEPSGTSWQFNDGMTIDSGTGEVIQ